VVKNKEGKVVFMDFDKEQLLCHLFNCPNTMIEGQPSMELTHYYTFESDVFEVYIIHSFFSSFADTSSLFRSPSSLRMNKHHLRKVLFTTSMTPILFIYFVGPWKDISIRSDFGFEKDR
jgi:hypothetical protein